MDRSLILGFLFSACGSICFTVMIKGIRDDKLDIVLPFSYGTFVFLVFAVLNFITAYNINK